MQLEQIIIRPLITEKSSVATEKFNRYGFEVAVGSNKNQIKNAVEAIYEVKVLDIKTSILPGKTKRVGKSTKKSSKTKKAFVTLQEGQKIEFFKGV